MSTLATIPQPPAVPLVGNIFDIDPETPLNSFYSLAKEYGEIYKLVFFGRETIIVNSRKLAAEVCDERRFHKSVRKNTLEEVRCLTGDGLFTAYHGEENWGIAHRVLSPAFGPASILGMFDDMYDILSQLVLKWERFGPKHAIDPADDFTRLAFDTIAYCAMSYRLNSFYTEGTNPFVEAMGSFLTEAGSRVRRPGLVQRMMSSTNAKYAEDQRVMLDLAREIVEERKRNPNDRKDLLNAMLNGKDAQTGKSLSDTSIMQQMITFLIAGHETTSGFLSFFMYYVIKYPAVYSRLQAEIDTVLGTEKISREHLSKLPYMVAVMREVMRLKSTILGFAVEAPQDEVIGGRFFVKKETSVFVMACNVHRDPEVWGDDVEEFRPERMLDGKFEALPPKAWMPFGNGQRSCLGRSFVWQEASMAIATLFQRFDFRACDPSYELKIKQTLTIKTQGFKFFAIPRKDRTAALEVPSLSISRKASSGALSLASTASTKLKPMYVLYGSNTGSCEAFAQRVANVAPRYGFGVSIGTLDSVTSKIPTDGPVVIITASFEGEPPDNAGHFVKFIESAGDIRFAGVRYAVFGCGNHDWVHTYQRIPTLVDTTLAAKGAERLVERGEADAGGDRFFESFDEWEEKLWPTLVQAFDAVATASSKAGLGVTVSSPSQRASTLRQQDTGLGTVTVNKLLTKPGANDKHHLEFKLPEGMTYRAGDYLAVLPTNPSSSVKRVLARFNLTADQELSITSATPTTLPVDRPVNVFDLFSGYVELAQPATRKSIEFLIEHAPSDGPTRSALQHLVDDYAVSVLESRVSILAVLEAHPDVDLPLSKFLDMLPAMRVRQYSISSSPLWDPTRVTLTIGVLREAALADSKELFQGVASTYLSGLRKGDRIHIAVRPSTTAFHLPADPATPIVMFASGSGIAPMRGFIQERAAQKAAGREVGPALLFYGCRSPDLDFLYADAELEEWIARGVVDVRPAFSRATDKSEGCKYVQDRVLHDRLDVITAFQRGARLYTCGSSRVAAGIKSVCMRMLQDLEGEALPHNDQSLDDHWAKVMSERYAADIFG
ncbi:cytochrome P450 [Exidia glandulosa HHB12029]|uniref:Cytochrome P450 n=1 Tax=Exidia glandulosa HHB12029 TaxID=1314781 RepID=A0A165QD60_EXIGL|nr:cytochrome P450 [Exidia glandulosa HHB12029]